MSRVGLSHNSARSDYGFALLVTLIVVGVVLSVGLSLLELSVKQVRLSSNAKESEVAFHAANAGMECSRYIRRSFATEMETGQDIEPKCFDSDSDPDPVSADDVSATNLDDDSDGEAYIYDYSFDWGVFPNERCTEITTLVASSSVLGNGVTTTDMQALIPGYPDGIDEKYCEAGSRCTVLSVRGYNKSCLNSGSYGTIQREVLLQF